MKTNLLHFLAFASILIFNISVYTQVSQEWVSIFNGSANSLDYSLCAAADNSGNVIVTGNAIMSGTGRDITTVKYNQSGVQQWVKTYNGEAFGGDYSNAIAVDQYDNIYITGRSDRGGTILSDITTIKYNSAGVQQWIAFYNGPGSGVDEGFALVLDQSGNVYVAGRCMGSSGQDMAVIKYNISGVQQWAQYYNGTAGSLDAARSVAVDETGNVYICGWSYGSTSGSDFTVIKYNSSGAEQWVKRINGTGNGGDAAEKIEVDASGGVYAAGYVTSLGGSAYDFYTVKYNSSGALQWEHTYNGPDNLYDLAHSMDLDGTGNVYVGGESQKSGPNYDFALVKYSTDGNELWVRRFNGPANGNDYPTCVVTDSRGNSYIGGAISTLSSGMDFELLKYNTDGTYQWSQTYNGTGNSHDYIRSIALNGLNYIYVTGESFGTASSYDYATIKYFQCALIVNAGNDTSIIWGYGNQTAVLTAADDGGIAPVSYLWSTGAQTQTINVSTQQTTSYSVRTTDARGCTAYDTVVVNVTNVKCGPGNQKILVCHNGKTICIDSIDVIDHLNHGDLLGPCSKSSPITEIPAENKLYSNYPNPFNPSTSIKFSLSEPALVKLTIYDYIGREVAVLINSKYETGVFSIQWNASNYPSGVYFYRIETGSYTETRKMILLK